MLKKIGKVWVGVASATMVAAGSAMATTPPAGIVDVSGIGVDTASLGTMGGVVIAALAGIWGIRKLVKTINRS